MKNEDSSNCFVVSPPEDFGVLCPAATSKSISDHNGRFAIDIPLPSVNSTSDPADIADDILDAVYIGEALAEILPTLTFETIWSSYQRIERFYGSTNSPEPLAIRAIELLESIFVDGGREELGNSYWDFRDEMYWQSPKRELHFPQLAEDYLANLLCGSWPWEDDESAQEYRAKFPESEFQYWQSMTAKKKGVRLFCSPYAWIGAPDHDPCETLSKWSYWENSTFDKFKPAKIQHFGNLPPLLLSESSAIVLPSTEIYDALNCSSSVDLFGKRTAKKPDADWALAGDWELSSSGSVAVFRNENASHFAFCDRYQIAENQRLQYAKIQESKTRDLYKSLGLEIVRECDWSLLDDDTFEQLCYDIIRRCGKFTASSVRKMGNSRSRDGGRDLLAKTISRPGSPPESWIIQCKHLRSRKSLSGSLVQISDVVDQYECHGFGVMTNAVIDATLFDKLDAIATKRKIGKQTWSGMELERFLQAHIDLIDKYF